jgi:site-specific recombinase XerD
MPTPCNQRKVAFDHRRMNVQPVRGVPSVLMIDAANQALLGRFRKWYRSEGWSECSLRHHLCVYRQVAAYLRDHYRVTLLEAEESQLIEYRYSLTISPRSIATYVSAIHVLYRNFICRRERLREDDPSREVDRPPRVRDSESNPVSERQVFLALEGATHDYELFAWIMLMRYCGLRCVEVSRLRVSDVDEREDGGAWLRVRGKGDRLRGVPVSPEVLPALRPFLRGQGYVFTRTGGKQWSPDGIGKRIRAHFDHLGIEHTAHHLRHSFATRTLEVAPDIRKVQTLMGHASPETTAVYTRVEPAGTAEVVDLMTRRSLAARSKYQGGRGL